jgi:hypothetical protein
MMHMTPAEPPAATPTTRAYPDYDAVPPAEKNQEESSAAAAVLLVRVVI